MIFRLRTFNPVTQCVEHHSVTADSEAAVQQWAQARGLTVLAVARPAMAWRFGKTKAMNYPLFCRELRTLLFAGMTVVEAVDTLAASQKDPLAVALHQELARGQSLSAALQAMQGANGAPSVPAVLLAAVRSGERTSNLAESLDDYLAYSDMLTTLRAKVVSAAIYPLLVTALGVGITVFLLLVVMPNFARMYENLRGTAKGLTQWVIALSRFMHEHQAWVFAALLLITVLLSFWVLRGHAKRHLLALAWAIPSLRRHLENFQLAMLYQTLHLLIKGGYPFTTALSVAGDAALNPQMQKGLRQAFTKIEAGQPIAQTLSDQGLCSEVDRRLMAAAERNGDFYRVAQVVSGLHRDSFGVFVERVTRIVEPLLLLGVALMVGAVVVLMYLPVFEMSTRLR